MPLHRLPVNTAIVGVQKAATSTLFSLLSTHPAVAARKRKELHFFDSESRDWDAPDYSSYQVPLQSEQQRVALDATPIYLFWPPALARMREYRADMRLLASFRDPVERAFSQWMMHTADEDIRMPPFDRLVEQSLSSADPRTPEVQWPSSRYRTRSVVARGFYGHQLERALHHFPREQWLLVDFEDVVRDQHAVLRAMTTFLDLEPVDELPSPQQKMKSQPLHGVDTQVPEPRTLERLAAAYADDLALFERLSGLTMSHWPTRRLNDGTLSSIEWADKLRGKLRAA